MTTTELELLKILDVVFEKNPGHFSVHCWTREFGRRERERVWSFIYDRDIGSVYFFPCPEYVRLPIGNAANEKEAAALAKEFLKLWLEDADFLIRKADEISRLDEEKRKEKERDNVEHLEENMKKLAEALRRIRRTGG